MRLPTPPAKYDPSYEAQKNVLLEQADQLNVKRLLDVEVISPQRLILRSPNGTRYALVVSNTGVLSATAI